MQPNGCLLCIVQPDGCIFEMNDVFKALADPTRRRLLDRLRDRNGLTLQELCDGIGIARQSVTKHLAVLESAGLIASRRSGRERHHYLNAAAINDVVGRWLSGYDRHRADALSDLRHVLENTMANDPSFVYTTYIHASPAVVWAGLTDAAFTKSYWGVELLSDWTPGSELTWREGDATISDPEQVVLECDPPRRLAYTWHTFNMDWAATHGFDQELVDRLAAEPRSRVRFEIDETDDGQVKLTVIHTFGTADTVREMCTQGWPRLLADLKTLLETDSSAPMPQT
jgi:DNA-binding transcriptional ArsR family regulator